MRPRTLYRIAAVLLVAFAAGHTIGFLTFRPGTPEGLAVWQGMNQVQFRFSGGDFTYGGFYVGFGLFITAFQVFSAVLAWQLGTLARENVSGTGVIAWSFFGVQIVSLVLALLYFAVPPAVFSALVAACVGWAAWTTSSHVQSAAAVVSPTT
jgi:hypothetical protein